MTIHITPEPDFSYVSFESNIPAASYEEVIERVLKTFKPGKFVVSIFANKESIAAEGPRELEQSERLGFAGDFVRNDVQYCRFKNYDLTCAFYSKFPSCGFMDASSVAAGSADEATRAPVLLPAPSLMPCHLQNRSSSSPQLGRQRSKVYRRASLKSPASSPSPVLSPTQSRIIKVTGRRRPEDLDNDKENRDTQGGESARCPRGGEPTARRHEDKQPKPRSCSFLPILSLIPHTVISFQYPSPKMKFSWWRNKIS